MRAPTQLNFNAKSGAGRTVSPLPHYQLVFVIIITLPGQACSIYNVLEADEACAPIQNARTN
jgi:hypothetical protein